MHGTKGIRRFNPV